MSDRFTTETVDVMWSHLHRPDDKFGADTSNHNITVVVDAGLQKTIDSLKKKLNADKVNGMRTDDEGRVLLKAKTKLFVKKNVPMFPCVDALASPTEALPFQGDKVRIKLAPMLLDRDNSLSLFLNGVQIVEKNTNEQGAATFEPTEGFDGSTFEAPSTTWKSTAEESTVPDQEAGDDLPF